MDCLRTSKKTGKMYRVKSHKFVFSEILGYEVCDYCCIPKQASKKIGD